MEPKKIDRQKAANWLNSKWTGQKVCPICKNNNWHIPEELSEARAFFGGGFVVGGPIAPLLCVTCSNCGHVLNFNALVMGLVGDDKDKKPDQDKKDIEQRERKEANV